MKKITAIETQKKNPKRVNVYLDGEFAFGLSRLAAAWLAVGQSLDEEKIAKLQTEDALEKAYQQAMLVLSYRARSEAEIRKNLAKHEFPPAVIEETVKRLREEHLLNDERFAQDWVANRAAFRPRSRRALTAELRQKGLAEADILAALKAVDETDLAYAAAQKQVRKYAALEWPAFRKKLSEFLARRGFEYEIIAPTVNRLWNERGENCRTDFNEEIS